MQEEADAQRGAAPLLDEDYAGPATIETYTVFYERDGAPKFGVVIGRTSSGARALARVEREDSEMIAFLTSGDAEPVGAAGLIVPAEDNLKVWRSA